MNSVETEHKSCGSEDTSYDHVLKYTGVFGGVQVLSMLIAVIRNKLAALWLNRAGIGFFMMYSNISAFVTSATNAGIPFSAVRNISELYDNGTSQEIESYVVTVRSWSLWTALLGALVCVLAAPFISFLAFDGDWGYTAQVAMLAPMVFAVAVTNGEISILKGTRKLKRVALITALSALLTLVSVLPFFFMWRIDGVVPALVVNSLVIMAVHLYFSLKVFPWRVRLLQRDVLKAGVGMIKLGVPYLVAGVCNSLAALAVPAFLLYLGDNMDDVGLYKAGFGIMTVYAGLVFVAVEADYFPRLSALCNDVKRMNYAINQQIDVCVLFMAPLLMFMMLVMPILIEILYTGDFVMVADMAVCSAFFMFFKAIMLPIAYTSLAKGDSVTFLVMEVVYDLFSFALIAAGYYWWGITGTGVALSVAGLIDLLMIAVCYSVKYGFRFSFSTLRVALVQALLLSVMLFLCVQGNVWVKWVCGTVAFALSLAYSFNILRKKTSIVEALKNRFFSRKKR